MVMGGLSSVARLKTVSEHPMSANVALKNSLTSEPGTHFEDPAEEDVAVSGVGWIPRNGVNGRSRIKSGGDVEEQRADNCKVHDMKSVSTLFDG